MMMMMIIIIILRIYVEDFLSMSRVTKQQTIHLYN